MGKDTLFKIEIKQKHGKWTLYLLISYMLVWLVHYNVKYIKDTPLWFSLSALYFLGCSLTTLFFNLGD